MVHQDLVRPTTTAYYNYSNYEYLIGISAWHPSPSNASNAFSFLLVLLPVPLATGPREFVSFTRPHWIEATTTKDPFPS